MTAANEIEVEVVDPDEQWLARTITSRVPTVFERLYAQVRLPVEHVLSGPTQLVANTFPEVCASVARIDNALDEVFAAAQSTINKLSTAEWLYWSRRAHDVVPRLFPGELHTGAFAVALRNTADCLVTQSRQATVRRPADSTIVSYPLSDDETDDLLRLLQYSAVIQTLIACRRRLSRRISCTIIDGRPQFLDSAPHRDALGYEDDQAYLIVDPFTFAGSAPSVPAISENDPGVFLSFPQPRAQLLRLPQDPGEPSNTRLYTCAHTGLFIPTRGIVDYVRTMPNAYGQEPRDVLARLIAQNIIFQHAMLKTRDGLRSTYQHGGFYSTRATLAHSCSAVQAEITAVFRSLDATPGSDLLESMTRSVIACDNWKNCILRPLDTPSCFDAGSDDVYCDITSHTELLTRSVRYPQRAQQDGQDNIRAEQFEQRVQRSIDKSPWRPLEGARSFIGKELRRERRAITDIDALGISDKLLLIISCKSRLVSDGYVIGDPREMRSLASALSEYCEDGDRVIRYLRDNPIGDNYDLTGYEVRYCICLPTPVYLSPTMLARKAVRDLDYITHLGMLEHWLGLTPEFGMIQSDVQA